MKKHQLVYFLLIILLFNFWVNFIDGNFDGIFCVMITYLSGKLEELDEGKHPYQEKEPLKPHPDNTNPETGEVGGPKGPEPTRYGDWERKGRVSDF